MGRATRRLCVVCLGIVLISAAVSCASSTSTAKITPSPILGPLAVDLSITGDLPFAGHVTNAFLASHIPCTPRTIQFNIPEGGTRPVQRFQAAWRVRVAGNDYTVYFTRAPYRGPGTYSWGLMTEDKISPRSSRVQRQIVVYAGDPDYDESTGRIANSDYLFGSDGGKKTFVVAADQTSGTIDVDLFTKAALSADVPGPPAGHLSGSWRCK